MVQSSILKTLTPNTVGRDFVIGDLHGSMMCLKTMMKGLQFDVTKDRLISVGDLIDRGPESLNCLSLINEPWFHSVQGNHETEMVDVFSGKVDPSTWFAFGGRWAVPYYCDWQNLKSKKHAALNDKEGTAKVLDLVRHVKTMPLIITVNMVDGRKFHVMHAELPTGEKLTDEHLADPVEVSRICEAYTQNGPHVQWGRSIFGQFIGQDISNRLKKYQRKAYLFQQQKSLSLPYNSQLGHIISGHSIVHCPVTFMGQTDIDTAAYQTNTAASFTSAQGHGHAQHKSPKWAGLTCINLNDWTFFKSTQSEFKQIHPSILL